MKRKQKPRRFKGPVGPRIRHLRLKKDWQQEDLADEVGVHLSAVSHWERGQALPDVDRLPDLAKLLDTTVEELIEGEKAYAILGQMLEARAS